MIFAASLLSTLAQDLSGSPIFIAILTFLAVPGITSVVVRVIRSVSDDLGINPRGIVYAASLLVTGVILVSGGGGALPGYTGDPASFIAALLIWGTTNARASEGLYHLLLERLGLGVA